VKGEEPDAFFAPFDPYYLSPMANIPKTMGFPLLPFREGSFYTRKPESRVSASEQSIQDAVLTAWTEQSGVKPRTKNQEPRTKNRAAKPLYLLFLMTFILQIMYHNVVFAQ
jgi:hypothetical protein